MVERVSHAKMLKDAALLRNRVRGCLKGTTDFMSPKSIFEWPSVQEMVGKNGYHKVTSALRNMRQSGEAERIGSGPATVYRILPESAPKPSVAVNSDEIHLQVDRAKKRVSFVFLGLKLTIEVVS